MREKQNAFRIFAHRGDMAFGPENTLPALNAAVAGGAGGVEVDLRMTRDGIPVLFHDAVPLRVTLGLPQTKAEQRICDLSAEEVLRLRLPFGGHLLRRFPPEGYLREQEYYYPWELGAEAEIRREMETLWRQLDVNAIKFCAENALYEIGLNAEAFGKNQVDYLKERGILVYSNLGDTPSWWKQMQTIKPAGCKTNCLTAYRQWLDKVEKQGVRQNDSL